MRRSAITTIVLLGLAAPGAALAQGAGQPPAPPAPQAPAHAGRARRPPRRPTEPSRSLFEPTDARVPHRRPRHEHRRRPGALPALPGSSATGCSSRTSATRSPSRTATWDFHARADNVGYRDQEYLANYDRTGKLSLTGELPADSAVLQRRHEDAVHGQRRHAGARRRDAARDPERRRPSSTPTSRSRRVRPARAARHRPRRRGRHAEAATSTSPPTSRRRSTAASCPGAPASASATTSRWRCPTSRAPTTSPSAPSGRTQRNMLRVAYSGSWFDNLAPTLDLGQPAPPRRRVGRRRAAAGCRSGRRTRPRPSASAATPSWRTRRR